MKKKTVAFVLAMVLVFAVTVGVTVAYLTDKTGPVVNTFTVGNVNIDLTETTTDYKMIPGMTIEKNPMVTVKANSEDCWLFVKVVKSDNFDSFMTFNMDSGWTALDGVNGVFYRQVAASGTDQDFAVLANNKVSVKSDVTKDMMDAIKEGTATNPTLTFTAYACQTAGFEDNAAGAWAEVNKA